MSNPGSFSDTVKQQAWLPFAFLLMASTLFASDYHVPCKERIEDFAVSADGKNAWVVCRDSDAIDKARATKLPPPAAHQMPRTLYFLDLATGSVRILNRIHGQFWLFPAPLGNRVLVETFGKGTKNEIFSGHDLIATIRRRHGPISWSSDGERLYFAAGMTKQSDGFNVLGILNVSAKKVLRKKVSVSNWIQTGTDGHVLIGAPYWNPAADALYASFNEYDREGRFVKRLPDAPCGTFDPSRHYVATQNFYHGPVNWAVFAAGQRVPLARFKLSDGPGKNDFGFGGWNPRNGSQFILLSVDGGEIEIYDLAKGQVVRSLKLSGILRWRSDGGGLMFAQGSEIKPMTEEP